MYALRNSVLEILHTWNVERRFSRGVRMYQKELRSVKHLFSCLMQADEHRFDSDIIYCVRWHKVSIIDFIHRPGTANFRVDLCLPSTHLNLLIRYWFNDNNNYHLTKYTIVRSSRSSGVLSTFFWVGSTININTF